MFALSRMSPGFVDHFFDDFNVGRPRDQNMIWSPKIDVSETVDAYVVSAEIPGISPEAIEATIEGRILIIKGEKQREIRKTDENGRERLMERSYGSFCRRIQLPEAVDPEGVTANSQHGVVTITIPKLQKPRRIEINLN